MKIILIINIILAQVIVPGEFQEVNVCYAENNQVVSESFLAPVVVPNIDPVQPITFSPVDVQRKLENIPNFGLAKWHWWLFSQQLFRAQRQYAGCVERVKQSQRLLGLSPLVDEPGSPLRNLILAVREYEVPFDPIQNVSNKELPPNREIAIEHIKAAIAGYNLTVSHVWACTQFANYLEGLVKARIK